jgi:hypothetical protein
VWINDTIEKYYSEAEEDFDKEAFIEWHEIMVAGMQSLKVLRASIKVDFKDNKPFLKSCFEKLGYTEFFSDAKNGDHRSLHKFLCTFAKNIDNETRKKIELKNTPASVITKILDSAQQITRFARCFEVLEGDAHLNTYGQKEVHEIYETIQDISRIAMAYYQFDPVKRDQFNFYKVLTNL